MSEIRNSEGSLCAIVNVQKKDQIPIQVFLVKEIEEEMNFESTAERDERILSYLYDRELRSDARMRAQKKFKKIMRMIQRDVDQVTIGKKNGKSANECLRLVPRGQKPFKNSPVSDEPLRSKNVYDLTD